MGEVHPLRVVAQRPVVDGTVLSSDELRAQVKALQDGREEQVDEARSELAESLANLDRGLQALRARLVAKAAHAAKVAGGVAAVGVGVVAAVWLVARSES
ncbi:hypothetical protein SAMN05216377_107213 [Pseudonocardia oroxyli]|uniref:DUF3618 domain-containing protein n=1 Tax=Pseudonocardia oroxyli TaxID=366584 RepID=A0A1G7PU24_PSEOR|nr:hypothetical protein SAMN05216377_107213 [Pseudonocardia oroxyli]